MIASKQPADGYAVQHHIYAGLAHLPARFTSPEAVTMLGAIALQESGFKHRVQLIGGERAWWRSLTGPARGFWQFERAGVAGVLRHSATADYAAEILARFQYPAKVGIVHKAIAHNDPLAVVFARLLLWTVPRPLPRWDEPEEAWRQYTWAWRPGRPHRDRWDANWQRAGFLAVAYGREK